MKRLSRWFADHIIPLGAPGLFLIAFLDSAGIPIPQGVDVLLFALTVRTPEMALYYAALAVAGSLGGCLLLYGISRAAGHIALAHRVSPERLDYLRTRFERYEAFTLVLPVLLPFMPMKLFIIAAGVFEVRVHQFILAVLFARTVRYFGLAILAQRYGYQTWTLLRQHPLPLLGAAALLIGLFYFLSRRSS
jgi:membrane protein YqaA with SNARE-associated domain